MSKCNSNHFSGTTSLRNSTVHNPSESDIIAARHCVADLILLDSGTGTGKVFDWSLAENLGRDYILAGGLTPENVGEAVERLKPFAVDVSSGVETEGIKDFSKMKAFAAEVRKL